MRFAGNDFNRSELAGAFGDLGTLIPFVVGYITINRLDPQGVLLGFGLLAVATGLYFRTPMSVQPMKAIATVAVTRPETITPAAIFVSGLVTGLFWLCMGVSGTVTWLAALTSRPVVRGIVLGLGLSFIVEGVALMHQGPLVAVPGVLLTFLLLGRPRLPAMLVLLAYGAVTALSFDDSLVHDLGNLAPRLRVPQLHVPKLSWSDTVTGTLMLAVPQVALTLGNAIVATAEEHNSLFPHRRVSVRLLFPMPVLGVILFFGGIELAVSLNDDTMTRAERTVLVVTAGIALWNMGAAYLAGLLLYHADQRRLIRL